MADRVDLDEVRRLYVETDDSVDWACDPWDALGWLPSLVAEVERLRAEKEQMREHATFCNTEATKLAEAQLVVIDQRDAALAEVERLRAELGRATARANLNARLAADNADERDTATDRERERIANWFSAEADLWRIKNNTEAQCEYDRAAQMARDLDPGGDRFLRARVGLGNAGRALLWRHECGHVEAFDEGDLAEVGGGCDACESGSPNASDWQALYVRVPGGSR